MYHRLILQTPDGKTFIRYLRKNVRIFAEVLQADSKNELYDSIMHLADQMPDMPVLFYAVTDFSGSFYACVVIEADNMNNTPVDSFEKKMQTTVNRLINELSGRMKKLIIHLEPGPDYQIMATKLKQRPGRETDLVQRLISDQKIISEMEAGVFSEMAAKTESKTSHCLLLWPLFASLVLPHLPLLALSKFIVKKTVRDDHWTSSITFGTMILVGPLIYLAEILLVGCLTSGWLWALLFAAWLWPSGRLSLIFRKYCLSENETLVQ